MWVQARRMQMFAAAGLTGEIVDVTASNLAHLCGVQLQETKLQIACATPGTSMLAAPVLLFEIQAP